MRYYRECREGGVPTGRKIYEMHDFCECENCKWRYKYLGQPRNSVTVKTFNVEKLNDMDEFIDNWKCKDGKKWLPTEYHTI